MSEETKNEAEATDAVDAPEVAAEEAAAPEVVAEVVADDAHEVDVLAEVDATVEAVAEEADAEAQAAVDALIDTDAILKLVSKPAKNARYEATGKRKTSVARVILTPGDGTFWINGKDLNSYFSREVARTAVAEPLVVTGALGSYNVRCRVHGGGATGQAGALRHGIAKALAEIDPRVRTMVKSKGMLKVDTRQVERKKAGLKKARKKPQFSKR
jgi:small subunit ribosomal protein S9